MRILRTLPALAPRRPAHYLADMRLTDAIKNIFRRRHADETAEHPELSENGEEAPDAPETAEPAEAETPDDAAEEGETDENEEI